jgi:hypothetical protein
LDSRLLRRTFYAPDIGAESRDRTLEFQMKGKLFPVFISPATRSLFVHIQKTGGNSVEAAFHRVDPEIRLSCQSFAGSRSHRFAEHLWRRSIPTPLRPRRHHHARSIRDELGAATWESLFTFGFVRNPWDRLVSWYSMCRQERHRRSRFMAYVHDHIATFTEFVERAEADPVLAKTAVPQLEYLEGERRVILVNFVGRYESLDEDLGAVADRLGVVLSLPLVNTSRHPHYRQMYTASTRDLVARRFARDIEKFGYEF